MFSFSSPYPAQIPKSHSLHFPHPHPPCPSLASLYLLAKPQLCLGSPSCPLSTCHVWLNIIVLAGLILNSWSLTSHGPFCYPQSYCISSHLPTFHRDSFTSSFLLKLLTLVPTFPPSVIYYFLFTEFQRCVYLPVYICAFPSLLYPRHCSSGFPSLFCMLKFFPPPTGYFLPVSIFLFS